MTECSSKRVVVFVGDLGSGGSERVAVRVCEWLRRGGHDVCLLTLSSADSDFHATPEGVTRIGLGLAQSSNSLAAALVANFRRWLAVRRVVRAHEAEVVISLGDRSNVLILASTIGRSCRKIISERADPIAHPLSAGWALLRWLFYPMATLHVSQSVYVSQWVVRRFHGVRSVVIGNTAGEPRAPMHRSEGTDDSLLRIVAVGRLAPEKGIDLLLRAFAAAARRTRVPMCLTLVGDGGDRTSLEAQVAALQLNDSVRFLGRVRDVFPVLAESDVFVLSSRFEGFPNAMIEAMSMGLPVIAARCKGAVEDILGAESGRYALDYTPGDVGTLADHIVSLAVDDGDLRKRLGMASLVRAADYSQEAISRAWLDVVEGQ